MTDEKKIHALKQYKRDKIIFAGSLGLCVSGLVASFSTAVMIDLAHSDRPASPLLSPLQQWVQQPEQMEFFGPEGKAGAMWSLSLWPASALSGVVAALTAGSLSKQRKNLPDMGLDI